MDEEGFREFQNFLSLNPESGNLMPGTGGFRKLRWVDPHRGKGKRGGLRVVYYYLSQDEQLWLFSIYDKNEAQDLTPAQKKALKVFIMTELSARSKK